jgi:hypothetical protein
VSIEFRGHGLLVSFVTVGLGASLSARSSLRHNLLTLVASSGLNPLPSCAFLASEPALNPLAAADDLLHRGCRLSLLRLVAPALSSTAL